MWNVPLDANTKLAPFEASNAAPVGGVGAPPAVVDDVTPSSSWAWAQRADAIRSANAIKRFKVDSPTR